VVGTGEQGIATIIGGAERMWPDTLNIMGWRVEDPGFAVVFDRAIPPFIEAELAGAVDGNAGLHGQQPRGHRPFLLPSLEGSR
jgi:alkylresorcinol/alkylpyrone synthase